MTVVIVAVPTAMRVPLLSAGVHKPQRLAPPVATAVQQQAQVHAAVCAVHDVHSRVVRPQRGLDLNELGGAHKVGLVE